MVDAFDVESHLEPKPDEAAAESHHLAGVRRAGRLDALDPGVSPGVITGRVGQETPDDLRRCGDRVGRANVQLAQVPTPLSVKRCSPALSAIVTNPERGPVPLGMKVTVIRQLAPAASVGPQVVPMR